MSINEIINDNIKITWTLLLICFNSNNLLKNCEYEQKFISASDVINYAVSFLETTDNMDVASLAVLQEDEERDLLRLLTQLSARENCKYSFEFRKFRAMYIREKLPSADEEFIHGILQISELWDKFGFPEDSPNIYFNFEDYSLLNFKKLLELHIAWIKREFEIIKR